MPQDLVALVVVVDNGSTDRTAERAAEAGATVVREPRRGYGWACRAGSDAASACDAIVYLDGDGSMAPEDIATLLRPIREGTADVVCGRRSASGSVMPWHQRLGNRVIGLLLRLHGVRLAELGPFRAIRVGTLASLDLPGSRCAWPAQMLSRAARQGARVVEVPVGYAERAAGKSKVGGSIRGSLGAAWDIARVLIVERVRR
jgi:hypothetical protein